MAEHAHEAALAGLASDIAREIEAHDAFDCPEALTYVRAANAIAMRLVERFGRPAPDPSSQSERIAVLEAALRPFTDFAQWTDAEGWTSNIHREGISVWFGPSDFRRARSALAPLGEE